MRINLPRLKSDFETLGKIGATPEGGVSRPSWSDADMAARRWLMDRITGAGLTARVDPAGNIFGRWQEGRPVVLVGSHLDSVPNGGRYDGALGVLAGLECLRRIKEEGIPLRHPLELVAFTDEEGAFGGFFGSQAFTGDLRAEAIPHLKDTNNQRIVDAMARHGLDANLAPRSYRSPTDIRAYVELHIEQGPLLEAEGVPIGVVETITGIHRLLVTFRGRADHAGTTPMDARKDALLAAAIVIQKGRELVVAQGTTWSRMTVGVLQVTPGVANIVPARVFLTYELREQSAEVLAALAQASRSLAQAVAQELGVDVGIETGLEIAPVPLSGEVQAAIQAAAETLQLSYRRMPAMAGHDAQVVGRHARAGMIFIPCRDGRSHSPLEYAADRDIENGANVLLQTLLTLAQR